MGRWHPGEKRWCCYPHRAGKIRMRLRCGPGWGNLNTTLPQGRARSYRTAVSAHVPAEQTGVAWASPGPGSSCCLGHLLPPQFQLLCLAVPSLYLLLAQGGKTWVPAPEAALGVCGCLRTEAQMLRLAQTWLSSWSLEVLAYARI